MSIKLRLENDNGVIDLNRIAEFGTGIQATKGLTGLGLPPVTAQWSEGAGDGSNYRGRRVLSRDIDIPLYVLGHDREDLKRWMTSLSKMVSGQFRLVIEEPDGAEWYADVVRVGGGQFTYGESTIGEDDCELVITVRSGDPYFTSGEAFRKKIGAWTSGSPFLANMSTLAVSPGDVIGEITIENTGDATVYPHWTIVGPASNFKAVSPKGETLNWTGTLPAGSRLTIDTRKGTVVNENGVNKYADLAPAPRFWTVEPGVTVAEASMSGTDANSSITCSWRTRKWAVL